MLKTDKRNGKKVAARFTYGDLMKDELSERKKLILKAIVDAHIAYGEPVGSKSIVEMNGLSCSSATIRNEMAELEAMGYLEQPHTSAGRIPSQAGYRFYVDSLLRKYRDTAEEVRDFTQSLNLKLAELGNILSEASRAASALTNYTGISLQAKSPEAVVMRFETVYIDQSTFVLIMIFSSGAVKTANINTPERIDPEWLSDITQDLNAMLCGMPADRINLPIVYELQRRAGKFSEVISLVIRAIYDAMSSFDSGNVSVEGVNRLLQYPEYSDIDQLRDLLSMLENKTELIDLISAGMESDDVNVIIGREASVDVMENSTLIFKTIRRSGRVVGAIGVIGPRRMNYSKVIGTIDQISSNINRLINGEGGALPEGNLPDKNRKEDK